MSNNSSFYINIKGEKYQTIFQNIKEIFNGDYLKFISEIKPTKPYLVDIFILMRKYQYYLQSIFLNGAEIGSFYKSDNAKNCRILNLKQMLNLDDNNSFEINIEILPKFKKSDISFKIKEEVLVMKIILDVKCDDELKMTLNKGNIEISNFKNVFDEEKYEKFNKVINKVFSVFKEENNDQHPFNILNKFLNYIENYLPNIIGNKDKGESQNDKWTQEEQNDLKKLLLKYKGTKNPKEKMEKIASELKSKTIKQITLRYKQLVLEAKAKAKKPAANVEEPMNKITLSQDSNKKEKERATPTNQEEITKPENISQKEITQKGVPKKEDTKTTKSKVASVTKIRQETTDDIINEIINLYNKNYKNKNLSTMLEEFEPTNDTYSFQENKDEDELEEEEEEEEENEEDDNINEQKKKNKELIDLYLSSNLQPTIPKENLLILQNVLSFGEKYDIVLGGVKTQSIALAEIIQIKLILKCGKCNQVAFDSNYQRIGKKETLFYMGTTCSRCDNHIFTLFKSTYLHESNLKIAGTIFIMGGIVYDVLPCTYCLNCFNCREQKKVKIRTGGLHFNDAKCRKCNNELGFYISSVGIERSLNPNLFFLENAQLLPFNIFNYVIKDDIDLNNYVKRYDKTIQVGKPLPDYGTCKHYKQSFRWFRFSCCNKVFPCDECHDETISEHKNEFAKTILCGFCAFEQPSNNKICSKCGSSFSKSDIAGGFWEGGKGCRNKEKMSNKDSHKFSGSSMKTISKRKIKKMQQK